MTTAEAWPPGTMVTYLSASVSAWLPGVITAYNENDCTYDLDLGSGGRDHAQVERIRLRIGDSHTRMQPDMVPQLDALTTAAVGGVSGPSGEASSSGGESRPEATQAGQKRFSVAELENLTPGGAGGGPQMNRRETKQFTEMPPGQPLLQQSRVAEGTRCMVDGGDGSFWSAVIEGCSKTDGTFSVAAVAPGMAGHRCQVQGAQLRAPGEAGIAWPPGTKVSYQSASRGDQWLAAVVVSFNASDSSYNLDVREHADWKRVRPR